MKSMRIALLAVLLSTATLLRSQTVPTVTLAWDPSPTANLTSYAFWHATNGITFIVVTNVPPTPPYTVILRAFDAVTNSYFATARQGTNESVPSNTVKYQTPIQPPTNVRPLPPTNLRVVLVNPHRIDLTWSSEQVAYWEIERAMAGGSFMRIARVTAPAPYWADTEVHKKNRYTYRARGVNSAGPGDYSSPVTYFP